MPEGSVTASAVLVRTLPAATVVALGVAAAWRERGGVAVATAVHLLRAASPDVVYAVGRLDFPISYPNAQAAMFLVGFWPAVAVAARRELAGPLRALALGAAAGVAGGWLMAQSKGGGIGVIASTVVALSVSRRRLRLVPPLAIVSALVGASFLPPPQPVPPQT